MAATLDDLLEVAKGIRDDVKSAADRSSAEPTRGPAERISGAFESVARVSGRAQQALTSFVGTFDRVLTSLGAGMARFVQLANPATVFRFNVAVENAMSAMGRVLVPVMEQFAKIIQQIGNAIESLSPAAKRLLGGLAAGAGIAGVIAAVAAAGTLLVSTFGAIPALIVTVVSAIAGVVMMAASGSGSIMSALNKVLKAFGTLAEVLARLITPILEGVLVPALETLAVVLQEAADGVRALVNAASELAGMGGVDYDPNRKTALATRPAQMGDLRGYANRAYTSAFNTGTSSVAENHYREAQKQTSVLNLILRTLITGAPGAVLGLAARGGRGREAAALAVTSVTSPALLLARMAGVL